MKRWGEASSSSKVLSAFAVPAFLLSFVVGMTGGEESWIGFGFYVATLLAATSCFATLAAVLHPYRKPRNYSEVLRRGIAAFCTVTGLQALSLSAADWLLDSLVQSPFNSGIVILFAGTLAAAGAVITLFWWGIEILILDSTKRTADAANLSDRTGTLTPG